MISAIATLEGSDLTANIIQDNIHLWILPGCDSSQLNQVLSLPWLAIWNADPAIDVVALLKKFGGGRTAILIDQPEKDPASHRATEFVKIYQLIPKDSKSITQTFLAQQLKSKVIAISGLLAFLGPAKPSWEDIRLVRELAPHLQIMLFDPSAHSSLENDGSGLILSWTISVAEFLAQCVRLKGGIGDPSVLKLKNADHVKVDLGLLEDLSSSWTILTRRMVLNAEVTQEEFDQFLNGTEVWAQYVAGAPYRRKEACHSQLEKKWPGEKVDFVDAVLGQLGKLELETNEPTEGLRMIRLFVESGSGTTTLLRQTAMEVALRGYPTLLNKPFPRDLVEASLEKFIVHVQKQWLEARSGVGSGNGLIPVCLILDTDAEQIFEQRKFARILAGLNRRIVLIRALERSHDELEAAHGVYTLPASTPTTKEILALGGHLRRFCDKHRLAPMPADDEWRAYHDGLQRILKYEANARRAEHYVETLFLVGIHPFIKERVTDENSLEQYYYRKWKELGSENLQNLIALLAAVGVYGISLPYEVLRRHPRLDLIEVFTPSSEVHRRLDVFVRWRNDGSSAQYISLYIHHPAIGRLLSRMLWPLEGDFPFSSVVELLKELGTGEADLWVANAVAYHLGRQFKARSPRFSLETDISSQRAAREIFNAIPSTLKEQSRTIRHHEGRYHVHVVRACQRALEHPKTTTLSSAEIEEIASAEWRIADSELQQAMAVQGQGESASNIYNTMATNAFAYSRIVEATDPSNYRATFELALDLQETAIKGDPANDYALFQFVRQIQKTVPSHSAWTNEERLDLYVRAEARLIELVRLDSEMRWRHTDAVEAEVSLDELVKNHARLIGALTSGQKRVIDRFRVRNPQAALILQIRQILGERSLENAFRQGDDCERIRSLRAELNALPNKTPMSLSYLYRLFLSDPQGRLEFETRLNILHELKRRDPVQYDPYRHDEAALYCQLNKLDIGEQRFRELRQFRQSHGTQWFWLNEKILVKKNGDPRELILEVTDAKSGYARIRDTSISLKFQPYQFPTFVKSQVFKAYVRFTLNGFQAVSKELAYDAE